MNRINGEINTHLQNYSFEQAALSAYNFFWKEFCAYYVEMVKPVLFKKSGSEALRTNKQKILVIVLTNTIRLLHPMAPFITEELFQLLKERFDNLKANTKDPYTLQLIEALSTEACIVSAYPTVVRAEDIDAQIEERFAFIEKVIYTIRNIRGEMNIPPQIATDVYLVGQFDEDPTLIKSLVNINKIEIVPAILL